MARHCAAVTACLSGGDVVLCHMLPAASGTGESLHEILRSVLQHALQEWRLDFDAMRKPAKKGDVMRVRIMAVLLACICFRSSGSRDLVWWALPLCRRARQIPHRR